MMNIVLWVLQGLLAVAFLAVGAGKLLKSKEEMVASPQMAWAVGFSAANLKLLGIAEIVCAVGVVVPWWTGIAPVLTGVCAIGLALLCFTSVPSMARRKEYASIAPNMVLLVLALFVAWGRF